MTIGPRHKGPAISPPLTEGAWERLLSDHYLRTDGPFGAAPFDWIDATPVELARATGIQGVDPSDAKASFLAIFSDTDRARDVFGGRRVPGHANDEAPGYFRYLVLSTVVVALAPEEASNRDFRDRLGEILHLGGPLFDVGGLAPLWERLSTWCDRRRAAARPYRRIVLPDPGRMNLIGYSIRLAFPAWRDRDRLTRDIPRVGVSHFRGPSDVINQLKHRIEFDGYSASMRAAFDDFRARFQGGERLLVQHRFWRLVLDITAAIDARSEVASASATARLRLSFGVDDDDVAMEFARLPTRIRTIDSGRDDDFPVNGDGSLVTGTVSTVLEALASPTFRGLPEWMRSAIQSGILLFEEVGWAIWSMKKRSDMRQAGIIAVARSAITRRSSLIGGRWRPAGGDWSYSTVLSLGDVERLLLGVSQRLPVRLDDLATLEVIGGIANGRVRLGRTRTLPSIRATATTRLTVVPVGETRGDLTFEHVDSDTWALVSNTPVAGAWRVTATEAGPHNTAGMEGEETLEFDDRALEHTSLADMDGNPARLEAEIDLIAPPGRSVRPRDIPDHIDPVACDERLIDLLEAIYARGRSGWAESELVGLVRHILGTTDAPRPWDLLRILQVAGWIEPRQLTGWRARKWYLKPLSIAVVGVGAEAVSVLDGAAPIVVRERFLATAASCDADVVNGIVRGVWSPPLMAARGVDPPGLARALGIPVRTEMGIEPPDAPSLWPDEARSDIHRELAATWSWERGSFVMGAALGHEAVTLGRYRRARGDDRDVYIVRSADGASKSFITRASAVMEAHRLANRPLFEYEGGRLRRLAEDGHLPEPVGRLLRLTHNSNPGMMTSEGGRQTFVYPADEADAHTLADWFGAAIKTPAVQRTEMSISTIASSRHRGSSSRLVWRGRIVDSRSVHSAFDEVG